MNAPRSVDVSSAIPQVQSMTTTFVLLPNFVETVRRRRVIQSEASA